MMTRIRIWICAAIVLVSSSASAEIERWYMNEEWYDWHAASEFAVDKIGVVSVEVHFVGPGAVTPRGLYIRGDADQPLEQIEVLGIKDHRTEKWKYEPALIKATGTPAGKKWVRLARGANPRGFEPLTLRFPPGSDASTPNFDYVCVSPNERYITHGRAERWIRDRENRKEIRCGMPMGGIGAGKIEIARDGSFRNITTNNNIDAPFYHPDLCFMVASINGQPRILRDESAVGLPPVEKIGFNARYPIARLTFIDKAWPIPIKLTAWSPLIPGNIEDSSLPVAILDFELENTTAGEIDVQIGLSWENMLGSTGRPQPLNKWSQTGHYYRCREDAGNTARQIKNAQMDGIAFEGGPKTEPDAMGNSVIAMAPASHPGLTGGIDLAYDPATEHVSDGRSQGKPLPSGAANLPARMSHYVPLKPGEKKVVPFVVAWYMDHFYQLGKEDLGHYYHNRFKNAQEVAEYVLKNRERLFTETKQLHDLFDSSNLPAWFTDMLLNDLYVLSTDTWLTKDGRFSVNEGATNMYGVMGTMDQKLYASHHLALLFPELQMQELRQFGQLQNVNGGITHDLGVAEFAQKVKAFDWPDLCSAFSILSYQVYRYTGQEAFWKEMRPKVLKAIDCLAGDWDPDKLGVPGRGSTFDDEDSYRIFSYTAGLYLCTLKLAMTITRELDDEALLAVYRGRYDKARDLAMKELWTGKYFRYGSSPPPENKRTDASHFSQMAGEFWCRTLGFDGIFDDRVCQTALANTLALHWNKNFKLPPKIVTPDGRLFPRDGEHRNAPVSWPMHSRALLCGSAMLFGMEQTGWDLLKAMRDNIIAANGPDPWDQSLYYDPITARIDWGAFYMTAPASWLAYQALTDTYYDAVSGVLTIRPAAVAKVCPGKWPIITPTFWAMGEVSPDGKKISVDVMKTFPHGISIHIHKVLADDGVSGLWAGSSEPGKQLERVDLGASAELILQTGERLQITLE
ncbi:MAG: GH116 family glycosyl-hydrolase [Phycisphaerae bacterium]